MKKRFNVLVTRRLHKSALDELEKKCNVFLHNGKIPIPKKNLINKIKDMDGLICHPYDTIDKKVIKNAKNLKVISTFSVGFDHIDIDFAKSLGIKIGYTPEVLTNATAELTIGLILDILRRISEGDRIIRNKKWNVIFGAYDYTGTEVSGKTIGIIGMGRIGREVAKKANGLGMNVIYHNRKPVSKSIERKLKAKYVSESVLYKKSDVISLHVPYNKDTHHLMNSKIFKKMKKTSFLINTSRGKIVNEKQLVTALKTKEIQGAGMDVYESEPVHRDSLLLKLENVVLAPHVGSSTNETRQKMSDITVKNLVFALEGKKLLYSV
ncbi:MAG: D-glycerate dehydrogenase [Candidatus Nitrosopelagicus sp.]|nr:D-glycerate dehydrogenase [Candidatus Nitrosopelagicus sp.]